MARLLVLSVIVALIAFPLLAAKDSSARRGLKKAVLCAIVFNVLYWVGVRFVLPHLN